MTTAAQQGQQQSSGWSIGLVITRFQVQCPVMPRYCCCFIEQEILLTLLQSIQLDDGDLALAGDANCWIHAHKKQGKAIPAS